MTQQHSPAQNSAHSKPEKALPGYLRFSIYALALLTGISITALFIDFVENRGGRVFSTFVVLAIFTGITALDSRNYEAKTWKEPAATCSNSFFLLASLVAIWFAPDQKFGFTVSLLFLVLSLFVVLRVALLFAKLAMSGLDSAQGKREIPTLERFTAQLATLAAIVSSILLASYMTIATILPAEVEQQSKLWSYWLRFSALFAIVAVGSLAITLLVRWYLERELRKQNPYPNSNRSTTLEEKLPWPLFEDGTPYPMNAQQQPDFEAAESIKAQHKENRQ